VFGKLRHAGCHSDKRAMNDKTGRRIKWQNPSETVSDHFDTDSSLVPQVVCWQCVASVQKNDFTVWHSCCQMRIACASAHH